VTKLNGAFLTLAECEQLKPERDKVDIMIEKTQNTHQDIHAGVALIHTNATLCDDFRAAANHMLEIVNGTFPKVALG